MKKRGFLCRCCGAKQHPAQRDTYILQAFTSIFKSDFSKENAYNIIVNSFSNDETNQFDGMDIVLKCPGPGKRFNVY